MLQEQLTRIAGLPRISAFRRVFDMLRAHPARGTSRLFFALLRASGSKTIIVVAHRLLTVQKADHVLAIEKRRVAESGTHQQLLEADGV